MLGLQVVCHKDRSLEVTWGGDCTKWLGRGWKPVGTTPRVTLHAVIEPSGEVDLHAAL
jgi:hypothetical protein